MRQVWEIHRFIEKDYWRKKMMEQGSLMTREQAETLLEEISPDWHDYTFKLYSDGSVDIIDNDNRRAIAAADLRGACLDFYIRTRIRYIRSMLHCEPEGVRTA